MDFWFDMATAVILSTIKQVVKNPQKKEDVKKAMLKIRNAINVVYGSDPDFQ